MYDLSCTIYHIRFTIYDLPCTIYHVRFTIYNLPYTIYHIRFTIYDLPYTIYHIRFIIYDLPYTNYHIIIEVCKSTNPPEMVMFEIKTHNYREMGSARTKTILNSITYFDSTLNILYFALKLYRYRLFTLHAKRTNVMSEFAQNLVASSKSYNFTKKKQQYSLFSIYQSRNLGHATV